MNPLSWGYSVFAICVVFAIGAVGYDYGRSSTNSDWEKRWSKESEKLSAARTTAVEAALLEERAAREREREAVQDAHEQNTRITSGHADNGAAADRLRLDATELANRSARMPDAATVADRSAAATRAALVLSDLLSRSIEVNRELALAYDRARLAGETCERILTPTTRNARESSPQVPEVQR